MIRAMTLILLGALFMHSSPLFVIEDVHISTQSKKKLVVSFNKRASGLRLVANHLKDKDYFDIRGHFSQKYASYNLAGFKVTIAQNKPKVVRLVIPTKNNSYSFSRSKKRLIITIHGKSELVQNIINTSATKVLDLSSKKSRKILDEDKSLRHIARANNINHVKSIMIDPGHGGHDCGAMGVTHVCEKTIVLAVAKKLYKDLRARGYRVYMTRSSDRYISLRRRTEMANNKNVDLFISIHANSMDKSHPSNKKISGVETYFLSTARSNRARKVAAAENKDDIEVMNYFSKMSFLNSLNSFRLISSNKLAIDIQFGILKSVRSEYRLIDGGVREGPFWVLAGATMPSILIEIGYNSNLREARLMLKSSYQRLLAAGIADGIEGYFRKNG